MTVYVEFTKYILLLHYISFCVFFFATHILITKVFESISIDNFYRR